MFSLPPDWDFNAKGLSKICPKDGREAINTQIKELESAGYLIRKFERNNKGRFDGILYEMFELPWWELPEDERPKHDLPLPDNPFTEKPFTGNPSTDKPSTENPHQLNTKEVNTNQLNTYLINNPSINLFGTDRRTVESYIKEQIDFEDLCYFLEGERLQEIVTVLVDTLCTSKDTVRINNEDVPFADVADRFFGLDSEHIQYVLECIDGAANEIKNMRAYIPTLLFNAPTTMKNSVSAQFERDMRNDKA